MMKRLVLSVGLALAGCGSATTEPPLPTLAPTQIPVETEIPALTQTPLSASECFRRAVVEVYADLDGDAIRDAGEPPLERVNVGIIDVAVDPAQLINDADTSADGTAQVGFITQQADCGDSYLIGVLIGPAGYAFPLNNLRPFGEVWESGGILSLGLPLRPSLDSTRTPTP